MTFSTQSVVSDGTLSVLPLSIDYLSRSDISVYFGSAPAPSGSWAWVGTTDRTIKFTSPVGYGIKVTVKRSTSVTSLYHKFTGGAQFTSKTLDESLLQTLYVAQEFSESAGVGSDDMPLPVGAQASPGTSNKYARADHIHVGTTGGSVGSVALDTFTGDGSKVAFALANTPVTKGSTQVFIDSVYQLKSAYTLAGPTITFDEAPASGAVVEVVTLTVGGGKASDIQMNETSDLPNTSTGGNVQGALQWLAGALKYVQSGAGAIVRKLQDKAKEQVSIADFADLRTALAALGGANGGYGMAPVSLDLLGGTATFTGDLYLPINVSLVNGVVSSANRLIARSPFAADKVTRGKELYWPYMVMRNRNVTFSCVVVMEGIVGSSWQNCQFNGLVLVNSAGMWTEYNTFISCFMPSNSSVGAGILMDGNISGTSPYATSGAGVGTSDGSFGYNNFIGCKGDSTGPAASVKVVDGGAWYNGVGHFTGYARGAGAPFLYVAGGTNPGKVSHCRLDLHLESFGDASCIVSVDSGAKFWYNTGNIQSASPQMTFAQGASADLRNNSVVVTGAVLQDASGAQVNFGDTLQSWIVSHLLKRTTYVSSDELHANLLTGATVRASVGLESNVQYTGAYTLRPNDSRSANSRNWSMQANTVAYGDIVWMCGTTNADAPSVWQMQLQNTGLAVKAGFGCNGKAPQTAAASGGTLAGVIAALVANGILAS